VRLVPYDGTIPPLDRAPGWPHADTEPGLSFAAYGGWTWLIIDDDGRIAGECGVKGPPGPDRTVEIGYGLAAPSRGHGLGTAAVGALLAELRDRGVEHVIAEVDADNLASRRLLERLGFHVVRTDPPMVWFSLAL
jgi:RimJ/RimL family protein N-acetyltransferase